MLKAVKKFFNFSRMCKHQKNLHVKSANVYFFLIPSSVFLLLETDKFSLAWEPVSKDFLTDILLREKQQGVKNTQVGKKIPLKVKNYSFKEFKTLYVKNKWTTF